MATPNYSYEKRQRELEKKRKKEEKLKRKSNPDRGASHDQASHPPSPSAALPSESPAADPSADGDAR